MNTVDLISFFLVLVRTSAIVAFLPVLGSGMVPAVVKAMLALSVAMLLFPFAHGAVMPRGTADFILMIGAEVAFGAVLGFVARVVVRTLRTVGEIAGRQMGMALSQAADPMDGIQATVVGNFCDALGVLLLFVTGAHILLLRGIKQSFVACPVGALVSADFVRDRSVTAVSSAFGAALQISAPLLMVTFLISLVMALMARLVPEINILVVGLPLRVGIGLVLLMLLVPLLVECGTEVCGMAVRLFSTFPE
jgi:flagellar biosynthetic protein FliR